MKQTISLTTDAVIFAYEKERMYLLLIKRKNEPFKNQWALPGGFLEKEELLEEGCQRELKEETGLEIEKLHPVGIYDAIDRDPRGRTISVAFWAVLKKREALKAADDALEADWIALEKVENPAFDHEKIIADALKKQGFFPTGNPRMK